MPSTLTFPTSLPLPESRRLSSSDNLKVYRSRIDGSTTNYRKIKHLGTTIYSLSFIFTLQELSTFEYFYDNNLIAGSREFNIRLMTKSDGFAYVLGSFISTPSVSPISVGDNSGQDTPYFQVEISFEGDK